MRFTQRNKCLSYFQSTVTCFLFDVIHEYFKSEISKDDNAITCILHFTMFVHTYTKCNFDNNIACKLMLK